MTSFTWLVIGALFNFNRILGVAKVMVVVPVDGGGGGGLTRGPSWGGVFPYSIKKLGYIFHFNRFV